MHNKWLLHSGLLPNKGMKSPIFPEDKVNLDYSIISSNDEISRDTSLNAFYAVLPFI